MKDKGLLGALLAASLLASAFLLASFIAPAVSSSNYYQKSLKSLRQTAQAIKKEYAVLLRDQRQKLLQLTRGPFPEKVNLRLELFERLILRPDIEGAAVCSAEGKPSLWFGCALDLEDLFGEFASHADVQGLPSVWLIEDKASAYLVSLKKISSSEYGALFRLLAFIPQFKSPYLEEYDFLGPRLRENGAIDYADFREDVSFFDKFFVRHNDEYIGQPRLQGEVQSIFFPIRTPENKIIATITLRSPSLGASLLANKENYLLIFYLLSALSLVLLLIYIIRLPAFLKDKKYWPGLILLLTLAGLRWIFLLLSRLEKIQSISVFSPTLAGLLSAGDFTKSPADIFLTSFLVFLALAMAAFYAQKLYRSPAKKAGKAAAAAMIISAVSVSILLSAGFQNFMARVVFNSNTNLLGFGFNGAFFLLHFSLFFLLAGLLLLAYTLLRLTSSRIAGGPLPAFILFLILEVVFFFVLGKNRPILYLFQAGSLAPLVILTFLPRASGRKEVLWLLILLQTLFIYGSLDVFTFEKSRSLAQNFLKNTIVSQEHWARFYLTESFPDIDKQKKTILAFLKNPEIAPDLAHALWEKTLAAKFNWYSCLEIQDAEENILSRFSLNIPKIFRAAISLTPSEEWTLFRAMIPFMGKEKDFLIAYRDWSDNGEHLGRTVLYLSLDYDLLPFLYSANPYFELLRVNALPSLSQFDFRFAVFDLSGNILFNPNKISSGLPASLLPAAGLDLRGRWTRFEDKGRRFNLFIFRSDNRIYAIFAPQKRLVRYAVEFLKLLVFYLAIFLTLTILIVLAGAGKKFQHPLWSFANRVYISFIAVALIPLVLFTFFSRGFFSRAFSQQFTEKAEIHANMARSVMDDFIYLQQEEKPGLQTPPEDLVLWISTTIANDVNLYEDGRMVSSSRREFFDSGLIPELLDGEIYYKLRFENNPFFAKERRIGTFSFRTLTVPHMSRGRLLFISLPFPFEQQEIADATQEMIEFLLFISVFFIATVLALARGIGSMIVMPIRQLLAGTKEAGLGNLEFAIEYKRRDEMKTLIDGFNAMIKNLKSHQRELADLGKKAAWAEMARKVAHEIKNPLTPIQLSTEHLLRVYEDKKENFGQALKESISYINNEVENLRKIAQEFLEISKEPHLQKDAFRLDDLLRETIETYKKLLAERIQFREIYEGGDFAFMGDRAKLKIVLRNLLTNAIEAIRGKGEIVLRLAGRTDDFVLEIKDTGSGIDKEILDRIFEPYFSTKDVGTGLGLPISKKIVEDHGGEIQIESAPNKGTAVTIRLPRIKS